MKGINPNLIGPTFSFESDWIRQRIHWPEGNLNVVISPDLYAFASKRLSNGHFKGVIHDLKLGFSWVFHQIDYLRFHGWIEACLFFGLTFCIICYSLVPSIDRYNNRGANWFWSSNSSCFVKAAQNFKNPTASLRIELQSILIAHFNRKNILFSTNYIWLFQIDHMVAFWTKIYFRGNF